MGTAPIDTSPALHDRYVKDRVRIVSESSRLRAALNWVCVAAVFALALELTCRAEDWVTYRVPFASRYARMNDLLVRDAEGLHPRPNSQFLKWSINSIGFRGPEASRLPAPGVIRVIAVGASETFGIPESNGREYPRQLEDSLNVRRATISCPAAARFEVLNAAFAGRDLPTSDQDLRNRLRSLRPAIIVVYPSPGQYLDETVPVPATPDSSGRGRDLPVTKVLRPRIIDRMHEQIKVVLPQSVKQLASRLQTRFEIRAHASGWRFTYVPVDRLAAFEKDLRHVVGTIRQIGATPVLATHANMFMGRPGADPYALIAWQRLFPRATAEAIIGFDSAARMVTLRVGRDSSVVTVDAADRLRRAPVGAFGDFVHFSDLGAGYMADTVAAGVLEAARQRAGCPAQSSAVGSERPLR